MKKTLLYAQAALVLLLAATFGTGCNKDDNSTANASGNATVGVKLADGPADYDAIWLDVRQVQIIHSGGTATLTPLRPGLYNLLGLRNGVDTVLISGTPIPAGTVSQMRLILGPNNSIIVGGQSYPLNTPSAQESGLKLNLNQALEAGKAYTFWLDFDAGKSILQTGNGSYKLKPVIRAYTALTNGRISGYVLPAPALTTVYAINATDTFAAIPYSNGYFQFAGLPSGTYQVWYDAGAPGFADFTVPNVVVTYGEVNDLGTRTLVP